MDWTALFQRPEGDLTDADFQQWFDRIADQLMCRTQYVVNGQPHRFVEIEFYYFSKEGHDDIFAHKEAVQLECGRWYFHRTQGVYRSGSFKGLDISFGDGTAYGGVLIRGIEQPNGEIIDGPSLHVDHLLGMTGADDVTTLDNAISGRKVWDESNVLYLKDIEGEERDLVRSSRVGLTLKRFKKAPNPPRYVLRPYRYLSEPKRTKKGKLHVILGLHARGKSVDEIREITGSTKSTIQRHIDDFEIGKQSTSFEPYYGTDLKPKDLCQMHGTWHANYGADFQ